MASLTAPSTIATFTTTATTSITKKDFHKPPVKVVLGTPTIKPTPTPTPVAPTTSSATNVYNPAVNFNSIPSDQIAQYVSAASKTTGVPSDFITSILGSSVNNNLPCYLSDSKTGTLISVDSTNPDIKNMKPKEVAAFLKITSALGFTPNKTVVSCNNGIVGLGFFLPSTWQNYGYAKDPWNPQDVVMEIAAILGKSGGSYNNGSVVGSFNRMKACKSWYGSGPGFTKESLPFCFP